MEKTKNLESLSNQELQILSLEKDSKKCATKRALDAQFILWKRAGFPFQSEEHWKRDHQPIRKF